MPNLRAAASITRTPSGMTSLPMPSPAMTAMRCLLIRVSSVDRAAPGHGATSRQRPSNGPPATGASRIASQTPTAVSIMPASTAAVSGSPNSGPGHQGRAGRHQVQQAGDCVAAPRWTAGRAANCRRASMQTPTTPWRPQHRRMPAGWRPFRAGPREPTPARRPPAGRSWRCGSRTRQEAASGRACRP